ncbi:MAG: N-terminal phage integrase SAM-like domain-containing protein [Defluviitaleaceae bacterium]|nr:N-terminal phage integrase SAM-like domain-containing protein [Defluviitaleaceae bacterium]
MRKSAGEGLIRERTPGKWEARIKINYKTHSFYGNSKKEVEKGLKDHKRLRYEEFLDIWLECKKKELKPQSYCRLVITVEHQIKPAVGFYNLEKLDAETIQKEVIDSLVKKYLIFDREKNLRRAERKFKIRAKQRTHYKQPYGFSCDADASKPRILKSKRDES